MLNRVRFEHTFNLYYRPLCKYLLLFTDDFEMIEDVVQAVYVKLWEDREKIRLSRYDNMSYKDIAGHENISVKTVENHTVKALKRINA